MGRHRASRRCSSVAGVSMPSDLSAPDQQWLQPIPDALLSTGTDPADLVQARTGIRLAFIAALQHLPPIRRAALILHDVLSWPAAEVAEALNTTPAAVNSAQLRARAQVAQVAPIVESGASALRGGPRSRRRRAARLRRRRPDRRDVLRLRRCGRAAGCPADHRWPAGTRRCRRTGTQTAHPAQPDLSIRASSAVRSRASGGWLVWWNGYAAARSVFEAGHPMRQPGTAS